MNTDQTTQLKKSISLKKKVESIMNLLDILVRIEYEIFPCSSDIKSSVQSLIKDLCTELILEFD